MANIPKLTLEGINKGYDWAILSGKAPIFAYENNKRVSDTPVAWRLTVLLPGNMLSPLTVKVTQATDPLPSVTDEKIEAACASLKLLYVRLTECVISVYAIDGLKMTATASHVELVTPGK